MTFTFTDELVRRMRPNLKGQYAVQSAIPLEIKLRLERLRLMEIIRAEGQPQTPKRPLPVAKVTITAAI
ncbi:MAG: hypothetical protein WDN31_22695 [Hyphomicrobium sp.]